MPISGAPEDLQECDWTTKSIHLTQREILPRRHCLRAKNGTDISQTEDCLDSKGDYLSLDGTVRGESTHKILQEIIPASIGKNSIWLKPCTGRGPFTSPAVALDAWPCIAARCAFPHGGHQIVKLNLRTPFFWASQKILSQVFRPLKDALAANCVLVNPAEREVKIIQAFTARLKRAVEFFVMIQNC